MAKSFAVSGTVWGRAGARPVMVSAPCKPNARGEPGPGLSPPQRPVVFGIRRKPHEDAAEGRKHLLRGVT